jgi:pSer/pThr/pTyr-binding forkhead associated (FHA) protein
MVISADRGYYDSEWAPHVAPGDGIGFPEGAPEWRVPLAGTEMLIGRASAARGIFPDIDITSPAGGVPEDTGVSLSHARLVRGAGGTWSVTDLDSINGTRVNGRAIRPGIPVPLHLGDKINLGMWTAITVHPDEP